MVITPPSGPCDATVEISGTGFEPGSQVPLDLGAPHSDVSMGRLGVADVTPDGRFSVEVSFGPLGCEAAATDMELDDPGEPRDLVIFAGAEPERMFAITRGSYEYTSETVQGPPVDRLPSTGYGTTQSSRGPLVVILAVGVMGVMALAAALWIRRVARGNGR
jgi:hypothetical protein